MAIEYRTVNSQELEAFFAALSVPFGFDPTPERAAQFRAEFENVPLWSAFDGDQRVATFGAWNLEMTVPGGSSLSTAGTTVVTVLPTHRRQGICRALMNEHFEIAHRNGQPLAALWASESSIYGRFGFGPATERHGIAIPRQHAHLQRPVELAGAMRLIDLDEALTTFPVVFDAAVNRRPGMYARDENWWKNRTLADPDERRNGATAHRRVLHVRDGKPAGYLIYRTRTNHDTKNSEAIVVELLGVDPHAEKALWQFLVGHDLIDTIRNWNHPVDHPLLWWLVDPRQMERHATDSLWVRPLDVAAALNGRAYSRAGSLVFRFTDEHCPWNTGVYRLDADASGSGHCVASNAEAEIEFTPYSLGSVYLGGHGIAQLARAGVISGHPDAIRLADRMFAAECAPWCHEMF